MLSDIDPSGQEDRETWADLAHFDECLARTIGTNRAKTAHTLDIRGLQNRKHLVTPGVDDRLRGCRHGKRLYSTPHHMGRSEPGSAGVKRWPDVPPYVLGTICHRSLRPAPLRRVAAGFKMLVSIMHKRLIREALKARRVRPAEPASISRQR